MLGLLRPIHKPHSVACVTGIEARLVAIKLLEGVPACSVVVATLDGDKAFAVFGSTLAALAKTRHLAGFVVDRCATSAI